MVQILSAAHQSASGTVAGTRTCGAQLATTELLGNVKYTCGGGHEFEVRSLKMFHDDKQQRQCTTQIPIALLSFHGSLLYGNMLALQGS